ncbi:putative uncharacterized protein [Clostridium sp. CAG:411]|jgi:vacuolar-type H+-ATPase subunit I/STV1|nr:putative uncharacterized protein [Clostridium sp. CAG:411]
MERDKAIEIIHKEGLINFKMFEKRDNKENEVVLLKQSGKWIVYVTDERASKITNSVDEYTTESEALDDFIERLRADKILREL